MVSATDIDSPLMGGSGDAQKRFDALLSIPMLRDLDRRVIRRLADAATITYVTEGTVVCRQGDPSDTLHILLNGQMSGYSTAPSGASAVVEVVRSGQVLGLSTLLAGLPRQLNVQAITPCEVVAISTSNLMTLIREESTLISALLVAQATEFRALVRQVCDLKLRTTAQRLGCYLLELSPDIQGNATALRLPFDKRLLAARLGCRQENLSRAFAALRSFGVETHGARVILHDVAKLRAYSEPDEPMEAPAV
jgi:CRP/FNR family transcriptional activator FtrB